MAVTMVDKALTAANNSRTELLDVKVMEEFRIPVKTRWNMFAGSTGAYITERVDGKMMTPGMRNYITGLWAGWQLLDDTLRRQQEQARRR